MAIVDRLKKHKMKRLFLIWIFSGSLDSFSQVADTAELRKFDAVKLARFYDIEIINTPDTLRAILLVTLGYRQQGIAHARMGFVVIEEGKRPVYLDCRKRALKWPQVGWDWREVDLNYNQK